MACLDCRWCDEKGDCWNWMPDSKYPCDGKCEDYEIKEEKIMKWDDKFGMMPRFETKTEKFVDEDKLTNFDVDKDVFRTNPPNKIIEGVGEDAEVVTNEKGGKQSKSPMAMHLVDPQFLYDYFAIKEYDVVIDFIVDFMQTGNKESLISAVDTVAMLKKCDGLVEIAKVLQYGAERYEANNWRLIPEEEHINHALIHYYAYLKGDTQDDHLAHCMCRLMMAYATKKSESFNYCKYISKVA